MVDFAKGADSARPRRRAIAAVGLGVAAIVGSLLLDWPLVLVPAVIVAAGLAFVDRRRFRALHNKWRWIGLVLSLIVPIWLLGTPGNREDPQAAGTTAALVVGLTMTTRALTTIIALLLIGSCVGPAAVSRMMGRIVGRDLGMAVAIGLNLLPAVVEMLRRTTLAMRLRGGFHRRRFANFRRLVAAVGVQTVRLTEDVAESLVLVEAAKGDSPTEDRPPLS